MAKGSAKAHRSGTVSRSVLIRAESRAVWASVSKVMELGRWVSGVKGVKAHSSVRNGIGAGRTIMFDDGTVVSERIVGWVEGKYISYIMLDGLPLDSYHATIGIVPAGRGAARVTWRSYFGAEATSGEFGRVATSLGTLYTTSLGSLKRRIEGAA